MIGSAWCWLWLAAYSRVFNFDFRLSPSALVPWRSGGRWFFNCQTGLPGPVARFWFWFLGCIWLVFTVVAWSCCKKQVTGAALSQASITTFVAIGERVASKKNSNGKVGVLLFAAVCPFRSPFWMVVSGGGREAEWGKAGRVPLLPKAVTSFDAALSVLHTYTVCTSVLSIEQDIDGISSRRGCYQYLQNCQVLDSLHHHHGCGLASGGVFGKAEISSCMNEIPWQGTNMYTLYQSYNVDISTLFVTGRNSPAKVWFLLFLQSMVPLCVPILSWFGKFLEQSIDTKSLKSYPIAPSHIDRFWVNCSKVARLHILRDFRHHCRNATWPRKPCSVTPRFRMETLRFAPRYVDIWGRKFGCIVYLIIEAQYKAKSLFKNWSPLEFFFSKVRIMSKDAKRQSVCVLHLSLWSTDSATSYWWPFRFPTVTSSQVVVNVFEHFNNFPLLLAGRVMGGVSWLMEKTMVWKCHKMCPLGEHIPSLLRIWAGHHRSEVGSIEIAFLDL